MRSPNSKHEKMKILASISVRTTFKVSFGSGLGSFIQVICSFQERVSCNLFELMEVDLCWKYLALSFSLLHLHYAYLRLKECMHSSTCVVFCIKLFQKKIPTILLKSIKIFNDKIARKLPLVILTGWSLDITAVDA